VGEEREEGQEEGGRGGRARVVTGERNRSLQPTSVYDHGHLADRRREVTPPTTSTHDRSPRTLTGYKGGRLPDRHRRHRLGGTGDLRLLLGRFGGFSGTSSSTRSGFVFPEPGNGNVWYTGEATSHESGTHGPHHQSSYSGTQDCRILDGARRQHCAILGDAYYVGVARRHVWYAPSALALPRTRNDMA